MCLISSRPSNLIKVWLTPIFDFAPTCFLNSIIHSRFIFAKFVHWTIRCFLVCVDPSQRFHKIVFVLPRLLSFLMIYFDCLSWIVFLRPSGGLRNSESGYEQKPHLIRMIVNTPPLAMIAPFDVGLVSRTRKDQQTIVSEILSG